MTKKLMKFEKTGCVPCIRVQNFLEDKEVEVEKVDVFANPSIAGKFNIGSVPTIVLVNGEGNEIGRSVGYNEEELEALISQL